MKILDHLYFYHSIIILFSQCKRCGAKEKKKELSTEALQLSFAKFLEIFFYNSTLKSTCGHGFFKDCKIFFETGNILVTFDYKPEYPYDIAIKYLDTFNTEWFDNYTKERWDQLEVHGIETFTRFSLKIDELRKICLSLNTDVTTYENILNSVESDLTQQKEFFLDQLTSERDNLQETFYFVNALKQRVQFWTSKWNDILTPVVNELSNLSKGIVDRSYFSEESSVREKPAKSSDELIENITYDPPTDIRATPYDTSALISWTPPSSVLYHINYRQILLLVIKYVYYLEKVNMLLLVILHQQVILCILLIYLEMILQMDKNISLKY